MHSIAAPMTKSVDDWIPTRLSLLSRLRDWDDRESWEDFFNTYWKLLYNVARQSGLSDDEAQEAVQETIIAVSKQMPEFRYNPNKGSFKGWLLKTTPWRISDQFRKRRRYVALDMEQDPSSSERGATAPRQGAVPPPIIEERWNELWEENLLEVATDRVKLHADPREFQMFDLAVNRGLAPLNIARKLNVTRAHVYYARHKIARMIRREMEHLQKRTALQS